MILDGELLTQQHLEGAYIYQNIHTLDYQPRHVEHHVRILQSLAQELFGIECDFSAAKITELIQLLLERMRPTRQRSIRAVVKQYASGSYTIECDAPSLYQGYALRSLRPEVATMRITMPLDIYPTSAAVATRQVADSIARSRDFHTALLMGDDEQIYCEATSPIALVRERRLLLSPMPYSVEQALLERAAQKAGMEVEKRPICREDVTQADEVLIADWQGITAAQHVDGKQYMAIIAERLAREIEKL